MPDPKVPPATFWATAWVSNVSTKKYGHWSAGGGGASEVIDAVDGAINRALNQIVGVHGMCEVQQVSMCPIYMGDSVSLLITVLARKL